jgi:nucleoside-diphosphate-sugar epimerase
MRVFVAGATGAIGQQLVPRLVAAGHEVHGMTRSESKQAMLDELGAVPVVADALDPVQVAEARATAPSTGRAPRWRRAGSSSS